MRCVRGLKTKIVILAVWSMAVAGVTFHPSLSPTGHHHHGRRHLAGDSSTHYSKWIVVTTVNYPTDTIKTLARVPGWRTVVVADLKTPADWALDGVDFLTVEMQRTLGYSILPLLPNNHYGCAPLPHTEARRQALLTRCAALPAARGLAGGMRCFAPFVQCMHMGVYVSTSAWR